MISVPAAFARALGQLADPAVLRILAKSVLLTLLVFVALGVALYYAMAWMLGAAGISYGDELGALAAVLATVIGGWLLFRLVALFVLQFFAEDVVLAVEARYYPKQASTARELPFAEALRNSLRSTGRALLVNLVALPVALVLLVTGVGTAILFWAVNAWLLGPELQDMVWLRHRTGDEAGAPLGKAKRFALGGAVAALLIVPFVNLLAPVLGAASATHLVHGRKRTAA